MSGWSDPQKGGRAVGAALYPTLSSLLSTAPKPGMRATASDAPGSMLYEAGGKWGGDPGVFTSTTDPNYIAYMAAIAAQTVVPSAVILIGTATETAVAMYWGPFGYAPNGNFPNENTLFDFTGLPDGSLIPETDEFGRPIYLFTNPGGIVPVISGGGISQPSAGVGAVYMDTLKHSSDISEAGCVFQLRDSGQVAICLWSDYTSIQFPAGHLNTACHLVVSTTGIHFDVWNNGVYAANLGTTTVSIPLNTDTSMAVQFSEDTAQVSINGDIVMVVTDARIATLGRRVGCFELYVSGAVLGPKIKKGYTISDARTAILRGEFPGNLVTSKLNVGNPSALTISGTFQTILPAITVPKKGNYCLSVVMPVVQTAPGEIYIDALRTREGSADVHAIVAVSTGVVSNMMPAMISLPNLLVGDTITLQVAKSGGAAGSIPASTGYNTISALLSRTA